MSEFEPDPARWQRLVSVMARLRGPDGCPWDREQTSGSLRKYIVEEAYEVLEAIDADDPKAVAEELGDLLLQIVFQAQIAAEAGSFTIDDVLDGITGKLVRRHPHVFGDVEVSGAGEVIRNWEEIKKSEKKRESLFEGIPGRMPALRRAARIQQRASTVGFDWDDVKPVVRKLREEIEELEKSLSGEEGDPGHELGDLLFAAVNVARHAGVEAEDALNAASNRFVSRFRYVERRLRERGSSPGEASLEEMDELWEEAKRQESVPEDGQERVR